jgi:uncharacterized protein YbjT (DUF2867 family)
MRATPNPSGGRSKGLTSPTTSCTRSARVTSRGAIAPPRTVAEQAARAGLTQLVYLGGLGDDSPELSTHLRSRLETQQELASGAVPLTTLRTAIVIGRGSAGFETIVALVDRLPAMVCPRWVGVRTQPIAIADVAEYLAGVAAIPKRSAKASTPAGPK